MHTAFIAPAAYVRSNHCLMATTSPPASREITTDGRTAMLLRAPYVRVRGLSERTDGRTSQQLEAADGARTLGAQFDRSVGRSGAKRDLRPAAAAAAAAASASPTYASSFSLPNSGLTSGVCISPTTKLKVSRPHIANFACSIAFRTLGICTPLCTPARLDGAQNWLRSGVEWAMHGTAQTGKGRTSSCCSRRCLRSPLVLPPTAARLSPSSSSSLSAAEL